MNYAIFPVSESTKHAVSQCPDKLSCEIDLREKNKFNSNMLLEHYFTRK